MIRWTVPLFFFLFASCSSHRQVQKPKQSPRPAPAVKERPSSSSVSQSAETPTTSTTPPDQQQDLWLAENLDVLNQVESRTRGNPFSVGVVLPFSGKFAGISQKYLRGLQFGLGLSDGKTSNFKLAVADSQGHSELARQGVQRLADEEDVIVIVGDILNKTAQATATQASLSEVPLINLSQKPDITAASGSTYRQALTIDAQVLSLVRFAMTELQVKNFAILYPNDSYGVESANVFWNQVSSRGGKISAAQVYDPKDKNFSEAVQRLGLLNFKEARIEELKIRQKEAQEKSQGKNKSTLRRAEEQEVLPPIVDFQAIFVPDGTESLGQIAAMLSYHGIKNVWLLGTNLWRTPDLRRRAQNFSDRLIFTDGVFAEGSLSHPFYQEYQKLFGESPSIFEVIGFDVGLMIRQLVQSGHRNRKDFAEGLSELRAFPGAAGPVYLSPERDFVRPIQILTLKEGEISPYLRHQ